MIVLLLSFAACDTQGQLIKGRILDTNTKKPLPGTIVYLIDAKKTGDTLLVYHIGIDDRHHIIDSVITDSSGNYLFKQIKPGRYYLVAEYILPFLERYNACGMRQGCDTALFVKHKQVAVAKPIYLAVSCPYDKTANQDFCPECKKKDKVRKLVFGLPVLDENGGISGNDGKSYYNGICSSDPYCRPGKHCIRCDLDF